MSERMNVGHEHQSKREQYEQRRLLVRDMIERWVITGGTYQIALGENDPKAELQGARLGSELVIDWLRDHDPLWMATARQTVAALEAMPNDDPERVARLAGLGHALDLLDRERGYHE